jgi:hypothetical protein
MPSKSTSLLVFCPIQLAGLPVICRVVAVTFVSFPAGSR